MNTIANTTAAKLDLRWPWLLGWQFDVSFFLAPAFLAIGLCLWEQGHSGFLVSYAALYANFNALNIIHAAGTYFQYFDRENRAYYLGTPMQRFKFLFAPLLVVAAFTFGTYLYAPLFISIYAIWTIPHFVKQNIGIYLLYQNAKSGEAVLDRNLINYSTWIAFAFLFCCFLNRTQVISAPLMNGITGAAFIALSYAFWKLFTQAASGKAINIPGFLFYVTSLLMFLPFAINSFDYAMALFMPSVIHWMQYIGLSYVLIKRKYVINKVDTLPFSRPILFFVVFAALNLAIYFPLLSALRAGLANTPYLTMVNGFFLGVATVHYLLDGFIWKFKEAHNRKSLLPYLINQ